MDDGQHLSKSALTSTMRLDSHLSALSDLHLASDFAFPLDGDLEVCCAGPSGRGTQVENFFLDQCTSKSDHGAAVREQGDHELSPWPEVSAAPLCLSWAIESLHQLSGRMAEVSTEVPYGPEMLQRAMRDESPRLAGLEELRRQQQMDVMLHVSHADLTSFSPEA
jgi:hypothetical protein